MKTFCALPFCLGIITSCSDKTDLEAPTELSEAEAESLWKEAPDAEGVPGLVKAMDHEDGAYAQVCAACHGSRGEGNEEIKSPSIAGLPAWYIEEQFRKFRKGERGIHLDDLQGQQMRAIALTLTEDQITEAAETVSNLPIILTEAPGPDAQIEKGRYLFANECMECHRYNGKGEVVFKSAQLISLNRSYIRRQLENFHEGKRGTAETDAYGNKMVNVTSGLSDEEIDLLVDYIGALAHGDDPRPARDR
ncbi:MAG: c-type cytochrome [Verrucomicrobiales bacterium]|nr:c-type cytochrome [Verrucomicrobiales bacterium]